MIRTHVLVSFTSCAVAALIASTTSAAIVNGGFESPVVASNGFSFYSQAGQGIAGWTIAGGGYSDVIGSTYTGVGLFPTNGTQYLYLADALGYSGQSIAQAQDLSAGGYDVKFDFAALTGYTGFLKVNLTNSSNVLVKSQSYSTSGTSWAASSFAFTVPSNDTYTLKFESGSVSFSPVCLDNITIETVPEPATMSLGIACALYFARKRRA